MNGLKQSGITEIATLVEAIQKAYNADQQASMYAEFEVLLNEIN